MGKLKKKHSFFIFSKKQLWKTFNEFEIMSKQGKEQGSIENEIIFNISICFQTL